MKGEMPEFGLTHNRIAQDIRERMAGIAELLPLITTNEQWQAILAKADPELREDVRAFLEPMLMFQVPGGLPQEPEATRRLIYGSVKTLEGMIDADEEAPVVEGSAVPTPQGAEAHPDV